MGSFLILYTINKMSSSNNISNNNTTNTTNTISISTILTTSTTIATTTMNRTTRTVRTVPSTPLITWNERDIRLLIDQRKNRNVEYHRTVGRSRAAFWASVSRRIRRSGGSSNFSPLQCRRKFENLVTMYYVSN